MSCALRFAAIEMLGPRGGCGNLLSNKSRQEWRKDVGEIRRIRVYHCGHERPKGAPSFAACLGRHAARRARRTDPRPAGPLVNRR